MATWFLNLLLLLTAVSAQKSSYEEEKRETKVKWACRRTPYVDACLSHLLPSRANSLVQVRKEAIRVALERLSHAKTWARTSISQGVEYVHRNTDGLSDCVELYEDAEYRILPLLRERHDRDDARTWLSAAFANHRTCLDGLREREAMVARVGENVTVWLGNALALHALPTNGRNSSTRNWRAAEHEIPPAQNEGLLATWNVSTRVADFVVAKDGTGNYKTINEAVAALAKRGQNRPERVVIYVKAGVYAENVEISREIKNIMVVGDGIDRTIVTGNRNVIDGSTILTSATFGVSGDGFWARDMTLENTAGPAKDQAVALKVSSDFSAFYRCSFKGYQDTLLVHSLRQFYRDCHIYGTVDFIFGDAAAVLENCDIFVRRPMGHQSNMITAQGRDDPNANTGISIDGCRVQPAPEFRSVKGSYRSYLGRPWKKYSRTVFMKTDLDGLIDPKGWTDWSGDVALSTLYYGEYMNSGVGALTDKRVKWPGFHALKDARDVAPFTVRRLIQGDRWIPTTGLPFSSEM